MIDRGTGAIMDDIIRHFIDALPQWQNWFVLPLVVFAFLWLIKAGARRRDTAAVPAHRLAARE